MIEKTDPCTILVVDDEPECILPLIKYLETDFEILCATGGEQALEIAHSAKKPDLILLDILMPGMDGFTVCSRLKADDATCNIPVIFLTAKRDEIDETRGLDLGAHDYVTKPFSLPVVRARIKSLLNLKKELDRRLWLKNQLERQLREKMDELQSAREALKLFEDKYNHLFREEPAGETAKRILVVDDNPENVHVLIQSLEARYEIICAAGGQAALDIVLSDVPLDLILPNIVMPNMDGFEVCSRLKADAGTQDIPVIFITALNQAVDETRGLDLGAVDFITKPFSIPVVEARINAALRVKAEMDQRALLTRRLESLNQDLEARVKKKTADLKQVRTELQVSEKKYQDIYENAVEGIFQVSFEGRLLSANPAIARILGYSSPAEMLADLTDVKQQLYVRPEQRDALLALLEDRVAVVGHEVQFYKKDRQIVWVSISTRIVRDDAGQPIYLEGFITDISERKRLEDQLCQAAKMEAIGNLVGGVAHDFNNLMTAVIGFSDLLLLRLQNDDPTRKEIDLIKKAGESASTLTQRLLAFSRKQVQHPAVMDLNAAVTNMEQMLRRMIGEDIVLDTLLDPALEHILADPSQIEQVIMNLAVNARDAMPRGGKLSIKTTNVILDEAYCRERIEVQPGPYVLLAVSDNGIGMDAETLSHMFEPFFTTKARDKGTGLGLATVYGIVKQNGGHIWVCSEPGKGTTFKVYFPTSEAEVAEPIETPKIVQEYRGNETIMVAEDNEGVRELAVSILEEWGYTVLAAGSGKACLHRLADGPGPFDLLLTDVIMPDMDGKALARQVVDRFPGLKVLFMSGYADNVIARHGVLEKGVHFIQKPFTMEGLAVKVRELLDSK
jgi:PAS domain S-box-containing protein